MRRCWPRSTSCGGATARPRSSRSMRSTRSRARRWPWPTGARTTSTSARTSEEQGMLKAKDIDELIATLQAARSGERAGPGKDHDDKVGAIVAQLQQLKDGLSQHDDGVPEQRLAKRIAASDALYASPYDFLAPRQASDPAQEQRR